MNELSQKRWAELDRSTRSLFLYVFCISQIIIFQLVIFYNLIDNLFLSLGIAITISILTTSYIIKRISREKMQQCDQCDYSIRSEDKMLKHLSKIHGKDK